MINKKCAIIQSRANAIYWRKTIWISHYTENLEEPNLDRNALGTSLRRAGPCTLVGYASACTSEGWFNISFPRSSSTYHNKHTFRCRHYPMNTTGKKSNFHLWYSGDRSSPQSWNDSNNISLAMDKDSLWKSMMFIIYQGLIEYDNESKSSCFNLLCNVL